MATKKATSKTVESKAKYYVVMDSDQEIICQGEWNEVKEALEDYMSGDYDDREFINDLTIHELSAGKKLKFVPAIPATVEL